MAQDPILDRLVRQNILRASPSEILSRSPTPEQCAGIFGPLWCCFETDRISIETMRAPEVARAALDLEIAATIAEAPIFDVKRTPIEAFDWDGFDDDTAGLIYSAKELLQSPSYGAFAETLLGLHVSGCLPEGRIVDSYRAGPVFVFSALCGGVQIVSSPGSLSAHLRSAAENGAHTLCVIQRAGEGPDLSFPDREANAYAMNERRRLSFLSARHADHPAACLRDLADVAAQVLRREMERSFSRVYGVMP